MSLSSIGTTTAYSHFEKLFEQAKQQCSIRKSSLFNLSPPSSQRNNRNNHHHHHNKQFNHGDCLYKDLFYLWSGLREVILLDYMVLRDSDCRDLKQLSTNLHQQTIKLLKSTTKNHAYLETAAVLDVHSIRVLKIKFWTFFDGRKEEMMFTYLINSEKLEMRMKKLMDQINNNQLGLIFVDIDALDRKEPYLESGQKITKCIQPFIQLISEQVIENINRSNGGAIVEEENEIDFSKHLNPSQPFIPFDATLMNGILLNYPIVMFYGSRFPQLSDQDVSSGGGCVKSFQANHVLNNIDLFRYNLKQSETNENILQFVIPQSIYSDQSQFIDSTLQNWLEQVQESFVFNHFDSTHSQQLTLTKEPIQYDNIVL